MFVDQGVRFVVLLSKWQQVCKFGFLWHDGDEWEFHIFLQAFSPSASTPSSTTLQPVQSESVLGAE